MRYRFPLILLIMACCLSVSRMEAQEALNDTIYNPTILYNGTPKQYEIADIKVSGVKNYEDYVLIGISGLAVGQTISIPGDDITAALKRYWRHGLFSDVKIMADKIIGNKIYLSIQLTQRPRITDIVIHGVKKSEREDLQAKLGMAKGTQVTPNLIDRAKILIKKHFDEKGFKNAEVNIIEREDPANKEQVYVDVNIDKKAKVKVHQITIDGNAVLTDKKLKRVMKKTNEKGKLINLFRPKKFIEERYEEDKQKIIEKYNELGYRDAQIVVDSVSPYDDKTVNVYMKIYEGQKYYIRDITWVGNTVYPSDWLSQKLRMSKGDVYNQKLMNDRITNDEDAIGNDYYNHGYVFYSLNPVEVNIDGDSIDLEMRIYEGPQASISHVRINGNDRLYENIVRRELRTRPGDLFSKEALERSYREIAQMGHFNPENIQPDVQPNVQDGTVDINWGLESKANDQVEFSAGWGQTGIIGKLSLKFTNFSFANLFRKNDNYRGILPQGDGQTLTISGQTNGRYYQSYSVSFLDPWFGGKRPNSFSVSAFFSKQTDVSDQYYNQAFMNNYMNIYNGYGMYGYNNYYNYESYYDPDSYIKIFGLSVGWGKRLRWPDDYFTLSAELSYQRFIMKDWSYLYIRLNNGQYMNTGTSNLLSLNLTLARNSTDNPIFPRYGSDFSLSLQITPPYSLFSNKDYATYGQNNYDEAASMYKWIEYHKWKFRMKTYTALMDIQKCPVIMTRTEFGILGHFNSHKRSPFETFYVGGDGMTGYSYNYASETIALRGYENGSLTQYGGGEGYAYVRLGAELRYPLMLENSTSIYALGFVEAGNAWHDVSDFNPFKLKRSAGVGVRIFLPMIGMMGIDWAYGFDKIKGSMQYSGSQFHFIIGQEF
ncbi:BamA/TamA family outer membrane protein [Bacteroides caecicola]|uniref:BamA/TamA family outer membrane protein n=2 Tax=Bacteroidaceae TaxID=815 RepID=A0ABS2F971_9BACE|nr:MULTISPECIES: POTRA domain-containing protein [Bacteroidaceae]MBD8003112.1 BamA/TamA family outer membrane protein [Phocaeicola faecium]MBM6806578.1 BamA/TamA family outer membrane protein [Bacteroides caecicola]MCL1625853.1 BamA/TamA family outer membrane protein [Bacteroides caecicola]